MMGRERVTGEGSRKNGEVAGEGDLVAKEALRDLEGGRVYEENGGQG